MENIISATNLTKMYQDGRNTITVLDNISLNLEKGKNLVILGPSGSGKTTLLHLIGGLDNPTSGEVIINNQNLAKLSDKDLSHFPNMTMGFIFQFFYLHEYLTAQENVMMPQLLAGFNHTSAVKRVDELLEKVGLADRRHHLPNALSGGEVQRVAIARALANNPKIIFADEPTGNLDKDNAQKVLAIFDEIAQSDVSLVVITHDELISERYGHGEKGNVFKLEKGQVNPK